MDHIAKKSQNLIIILRFMYANDKECYAIVFRLFESLIKHGEIKN